MNKLTYENENKNKSLINNIKIIFIIFGGCFLLILSLYYADFNTFTGNELGLLYLILLNTFLIGSGMLLD